MVSASTSNLNDSPEPAADFSPVGQPGEVIATGPDHSWIVYAEGGDLFAACYLAGRLLGRSRRGWWVAGPRGERRPVADRDVAPLVGTAPPGWALLAEQVPLAGVAVLREGVEA